MLRKDRLHAQCRGLKESSLLQEAYGIEGFAKTGALRDPRVVRHFLIEAAGIAFLHDMEILLRKSRTSAFVTPSFWGSRS